LSLVENQAFDPSLVDYDEQYENDQSNSPSFREHLSEVAELLKSFASRGSQVVEVGCGKGQFVKMLNHDTYFHATGYDRAYCGNDPNIYSRYLLPDERIKCELVVLRHVLEHVQNPYRFMKLLAEVFGDTLIYCEVPDFDWTLKSEAFFDITYEHVNYFNLEALRVLFAGKVMKTGRLFGDQHLFVVASLKDLSLDCETQFCLEENWEELDFFRLFPSMCSKLNDVRELENGRRIFIWGAATKGCLFAFHLASDQHLREKLEFVVDISPAKWSKFVPGTSIPIRSPADLFEQVTSSDVVVVVNPKYEDEIRKTIANRGLDSVEVWTV